MLMVKMRKGCRRAFRKLLVIILRVKCLGSIKKVRITKSSAVFGDFFANRGGVEVGSLAGDFAGTWNHLCLWRLQRCTWCGGGKDFR